MKRYNLYNIVAFLTSLFLFNACQDEDLVKKTEVVEGIPVTLKLKLGATDKEEITTRAALEKEQENKVYDVFVYVFRKAGSSWKKSMENFLVIRPAITDLKRLESRIT